LAGDVTLEHPARIFLIAANQRGGTPNLEAWISARCSLPVPGGRQVCCEQINLLASGPEANKIPSIVTSLLVADVPGVLLWKARVDSRDHILRSLANIVDRVLVDTSEDPSPETGLLAWREFMRNRAVHVMYGDLAWTHLTSWRSVVAGSFNPPEMRALLPWISAVSVTYSSTVVPQHSGLSQSLLFVAWLASKLSWSILKPFERDAIGHYSAKLRLGEQAINIQINSAQPRHNHPGAIEEIALHAGDRAFTFQSTEHRHCIRFCSRNPDATTDHTLTSMSDKSEAELVAEELEVMRKDQGYEHVMNTLAGLLRA
jgi:glucose-6-phosphate dehydrogenase assembly protein OpcA